MFWSQEGKVGMPHTSHFMPVLLQGSRTCMFGVVRWVFFGAYGVTRVQPDEESLYELRSQGKRAVKSQPFFFFFYCPFSAGEMVSLRGLAQIPLCRSKFESLGGQGSGANNGVKSPRRQERRETPREKVGFGERERTFSKIGEGVGWLVGRS